MVTQKKPAAKAAAKPGRTTAKKTAPMKPSERTRLAEEAVRQRAGVPASAPTSASSWKAGAAGTLLVVPSGNTCRVRTNIGMDVFLQSGKIPNSLMTIINEARSKAKPGMKADERVEGVDDAVMELFEDPEKLNDLLDLANMITVAIVLEPEVLPIPTRKVEVEGEITYQPVPLKERPVIDGLYVDEVDLNDKMYLFNFVVGGTTDLEKFRE